MITKIALHGFFAWMGLSAGFLATLDRPATAARKFTVFDPKGRRRINIGPT